MSIDINGILEARGILEVCTKAGWVKSPKKDKAGHVITPECQGWAYPILRTNGQAFSETQLRWRRADESADKFWWNGGQPKGSRYYFSPMLKHAIEKSMGKLVIACGDLDMLTFWSAGKENCLTWFGEEAVPKQLGEDLKSLGVTEVSMYPDLDEAGMRGAWQTWLLLSAVGISVKFYRLPYEMGSKCDTNNLWIDSQFKRIPFFKALRDCPEILPAELELYTRQFKRQVKTLPHVFYEETWNLYRESVKKALGTPVVSHSGHDYFRCPLPTHTDQDPSFRISTDTIPEGWPVCSCGIQNDKDAWQQIGEALDVKWPDFLAQAKAAAGYQQEQAKPQPTTAKLPDEPEPPSPQVNKPSIIKIEDYFSSRREAIAKLESQLAGDEIIEDEPIVFPFKWGWKFEGFAHLMRMAKLMLTVGPSGFGKTSLMESALELWLREGYSPIVFSPEWTALDFAARSAHRNRNGKGLSFNEIDSHLLRIWEAAHDIPVEQRHGTNGGDKVQETRDILKQLGRWPGDAFFLEMKRDDSLKRLLDITGEFILKKRAEGSKIPLLVWDYLESGPSDNGSRGYQWAENSIAELKAFSQDLHLITWIFAQPRKADGRSVWEGEILENDSARNVSDNKFNLYFTINPKVDEFGQLISNVSVVNFLKNSTGQTSKQLGMVEVRTDLANLAWLDEEVIARSYNLNGYHGELED